MNKVEQFNQDVLRLCGMGDAKYVTKVQLTLEGGKPPFLRVEMMVPEGSGVVPVTRHYEFCEVDGDQT